MIEINVDDVCKMYRGKLNQIKREKINSLQLNSDIKIELKRSTDVVKLVKLFNSFKQTKVKTVNLKQCGNFVELYNDNFNYQIYNTNNNLRKFLNKGEKTMGKTLEKTVIKLCESKKSSLKLQMTVRNLKDFLNGLDDDVQLRCDYPMNEGMCEDQISSFEFDKETNVLKLNPLDTCIVYDMDQREENKKDIVGKDMIFAFSNKHKQITNEYHGRV